MADTDILTQISDFVTKLAEGEAYNKQVQGSDLRYIVYPSQGKIPKYINIKVDDFIIGFAHNEYIQFRLPCPINEYLKVSICGIPTKCKVYMQDAGSKMVVETDCVNNILQGVPRSIPVLCTIGRYLFAKCEDETMSISDYIHFSRVSMQGVPKHVHEVDNATITYFYPDKKDKSVRVVITVPFNETHKRKARANGVTRLQCASLVQASECQKSSAHTQFDHLSASCYFKRDWELYTTIINTFIREYLGKNMQWKITFIEMPECTISYRTLKKQPLDPDDNFLGKPQKYKKSKSMITERQRKILWIRRENCNVTLKEIDKKEQSDCRFAIFKNNTGFAAPNGIWNTFEWDDISLNDDNKQHINYQKSRQKTRNTINDLGPHTLEDMKTLERRLEHPSTPTTKRIGPRSCCFTDILNMVKGNTVISDHHDTNSIYQLT